MLRILILEDSPLDAELVGARLSEGGIGCELVRVQSRDAFAAALEEGGVDLILADYDIVSSLTSQAASALENAWLYKELDDRERALQKLAKSLLGAQEVERRRVAYEVHDGLAQVAVAAHQNLQAFARRYAPETEQGRRELDRILGQVRTTVSDARRVIANLRPTALDDLGLAAAISLEVERLNEEGYQVDCEEHLGEERLPREMEIALFRVAQEALTNVRKHAGTKWLKIPSDANGMTTLPCRSLAAAEIGRHP